MFILVQVSIRDGHCEIHETVREQRFVTRTFHDTTRILYHEAQQYHRNDGNILDKLSICLTYLRIISRPDSIISAVSIEH